LHNSTKYGNIKLPVAYSEIIMCDIARTPSNKKTLDGEHEDSKFLHFVSPDCSR